MSGGESGRPAGDSDDPVLGRLLSDRYRVHRKLGEGGMAAVYLAEHVVLQKKVAVKVLAPELARKEELAARFLQEARAASRIGHENVIDISDFGRSDGLVFFVMEYLEGADLGALLRRGGPLNWARTREITLQICRALRAAHAAGIIHRDLKPENVFLVEREGGSDFVKLLDFGIAKVPGDFLSGEGPRLTRTGMIFGTPEYMAPEQAEGKPADHRADLYSVGCVLYNCLTGAPPFQAETFMALLTKHLMEPPVLPSLRRPELGISAAVDALVGRALEKDRERRFSSADEMIAALQALDDAGGAALNQRPVSRGQVTMGFGTPSGSMRVTTLAGTASGSGLGGHTELLANVGDVGEPGARVSRGKPPAGSFTRFSLLVVVGIALGVATAIAFVVLRQTDSGSAARPSGSPKVEPAPPPAVAPPAAPTAPAAKELPEAPAAPGGHPSDEATPLPKTKPVPRPARPEPKTPPREPAPGQQPAPVPSELKPFPT